MTTKTIALCLGAFWCTLLLAFVAYYNSDTRVPFAAVVAAVVLSALMAVAWFMLFSAVNETVNAPIATEATTPARMENAEPPREKTEPEAPAQPAVNRNRHPVADAKLWERIDSAVLHRVKESPRRHSTTVYSVYYAMQAGNRTNELYIGYYAETDTFEAALKNFSDALTTQYYQDSHGVYIFRRTPATDTTLGTYECLVKYERGVNPVYAVV